MNLKTQFIQHLQKTFPALKDQPLETLVADNLLSPFVVELPRSVLTEAQRAVEVLYGLRENKAYQEFYASQLQELGLTDPGNKSICMSYDFHVTEDQHLKLIEVNTNASFLAMGNELYLTRGVPVPVADFNREELRRNIETEMTLQKKALPADFHLSIIDEVPENQRLYVEFLLYNEIFKSWGWNSKICDYRQVDLATTDFIYNRYTDFFLNAPESAALKEAYLQKQVCLSPNPYEYFLLADKQRMIDWSSKENLLAWGLSEDTIQFIHAVVPRGRDMDLESKEELWAQRKHFFFKPKRAYGSKQSYKGASVTRKVFEEIIHHDFIAQEYVVATEKVYETPDSGPQSFKYDLRCYAYQGRLQLIVARLYQGQVTNLRTTHGGFACVKFV